MNERRISTVSEDERSRAEHEDGRGRHDRGKVRHAHGLFSSISI
jgi:hypothetical protein